MATVSYSCLVFTTEREDRKMEKSNWPFRLRHQLIHYWCLKPSQAISLPQGDISYVTKATHNSGLSFPALLLLRRRSVNGNVSRLHKSSCPPQLLAARERQTSVRWPAYAVDLFPGQVIPLTKWLPCYSPNSIRSALELVGPVSVCCSWMG